MEETRICTRAWQHVASSATYESLYSRMTTNGSYQMEFHDEDYPGHNLILSYDFRDRMFTVKSERSDEIFPFCPYEGCKGPSGNGFICCHLEREMDAKKRSEPNPFLFKDCSINSEGIKIALDLVMKANGRNGRDDPISHFQFVESVGLRAYCNREMAFTVTRKDKRSLSLVITDMRSMMRVFTCGSPGCNNPAAFSAGPTHLCSCHALCSGEIRTRDLFKQAMSRMAVLSVDKRGGGELSRDEWVKTLGYLYQRGKSGFSILTRSCHATLFFSSEGQLHLFYHKNRPGSIEAVKSKQTFCIAVNCYGLSSCNKVATSRAALQTVHFKCRRHLQEAGLLADIERNNVYGCNSHCVSFGHPTNGKLDF